MTSFSASHCMHKTPVVLTSQGSHAQCLSRPVTIQPLYLILFLLPIDVPYACGVNFDELQMM